MPPSRSAKLRPRVQFLPAAPSSMSLNFGPQARARLHRVSQAKPVRAPPSRRGRFAAAAGPSNRRVTAGPSHHPGLRPGWEGRAGAAARRDVTCVYVVAV
jgi:hypothetical protein